MVPGISPVAVINSVPPEVVRSAQLIFVPEQEPERKSITASKLEEPTTVITCLSEVAINEYHISSSAVPVKELQVIAVIDCVAPSTFPVVVAPQVAAYTVKA